MPIQNDVNNLKQPLSVVDMDLFVPHATTEDEFQDIRDRVYRSSLGADGEPDLNDIFLVMLDYFDSIKFDTAIIETYKDTFWPMFVDIGWKRMVVLKDSVFIDFVSRTLPFAVSKYVNVKVNFVDFLALKQVPEAKILHDQLRDKIKSLDYPIAFNDAGKQVTLGKIIRQIDVMPKDQDLSKFPLFADIEKALFQDSPFLVDPIKVKEHPIRTVEFLDVLFFCTSDQLTQEYINQFYLATNVFEEDLTLTDDAITELGANLVAKGGKEESAENETESEVIQLEDLVEKDGESNMVSKPFTEEFLLHKTDFVNWMVHADTLRDTLTWLESFSDKAKARDELFKLLQQNIEKKNLENNDFITAIVRLDEFLVKNGYGGNDFISFDEKSVKFVWNK